MDYTEMVRSDVFLLEQMQRQQDMRRYIKEAQILSSGVDVEYRLNSINEDLGESLKGLWGKIKSIFNKIWLKFLESLNKMIMNDAEYLKTYQGIILNKKAPDVTYTLPNYEEARKRCFAGIPDFTTYVNVEFVSKLKEEALKSQKDDINKEELKQQWTEAVRDAFIKKDGIEYKSGDDFASACNNFFGGGDEMDIAASSINMTDVYNLISTSDTIVTELNKTRTKYTAWITEVEKRFNSEYKAMMDLIRKENEAQKKHEELSKKISDSNLDDSSDEGKKAIAARDAAQNALKQAQADQNKLNNLNDDGSKADESKKSNEEIINKAKSTEVKESYNTYSVIYGRPINEKFSASSGSGSSSSGSSDVVKDGKANNTSGVASSDTRTQIKNAGEAGRKQGEIQSKNQADAAGATARDTAGANKTNYSTEKVNAFTSMVTTYSQICTETITTIFGAKCNGITKMRKDYMELVRYHVRFWIGKQNDTDDNVSTQAPTTAPGLTDSTKTKPMPEQPQPTPTP